MNSRDEKNNGFPNRELQCIYTVVFERRGEYGSQLGVLRNNLVGLTPQPLRLDIRDAVQDEGRAFS
jgi:hypothetical protein